jgi:hypothetical protein
MLFGVAHRNPLVGTPGFDRLGTAGCGTSVIRGRGAGDQGTKQDDVLRGGSGYDRILGSQGTDLVDGGPGRDAATLSANGAASAEAATLPAWRGGGGAGPWAARPTAPRSARCTTRPSPARHCAKG